MDEQRFRNMTNRLQIDPAKVIEELRPESVSTPSDHRVWYLLGRAFLKTGDNGAAGKCFSKAVNLEPRNAYYIYYLGLAAERRGDKKTSEAAFLTAYDIDPKVVPESKRPVSRKPSAGAESTRPAPSRAQPDSLMWLPETSEDFDDLRRRLTERAIAERDAEIVSRFGPRATYKGVMMVFYIVFGIILLFFLGSILLSLLAHPGIIG